MAQRPLYRFLNWVSFRAVLVLPVLPMAYHAMRYHQGMETIFSPGSLAPAHGSLDCQSCHVEPWRGWRGIWEAGHQAGAIMDRACAHCHGGLLEQRPQRGPSVELATGTLMLPQWVAPHHPRQIAGEVGKCADCHHEHEADKALLQVTEDQCRRFHRDLHTADGAHRFYPAISAFESDHPPFGWWRAEGVKDTAALHFNHEVHLHVQAAGLRGMDRALERLKNLECGSCHQPDARGRHMVPVRYDRDCAQCHPLNVRIPSPARDRTVEEAVEAFCRQPAPHVAPPLISAVLRERLRLLAQENPKLWKQGGDSDTLRAMPGLHPERWVAHDLSNWVDAQTTTVERLLFDSPAGCRYCHIPKNRSTTGWGAPEFEGTNVPVSWFPYAKFSHAKHGLMACTECHSHAKTSTRTSDVLLPPKEKCLNCHSSEAPRVRARADCLECHEYHGSQ
jgi:hypothetical protein